MKKFDENDRETRARGRPVKKTMPDPIPDTPENIAKAILGTLPKGDDDWYYLTQPRTAD